MAWRINTMIKINYHNFWLLYTLSGILYIIEFKGVQTAVSKMAKMAKMAKNVQNGQNGQKRSKWPNLISDSLFHFSPFFKGFFQKTKAFSARIFGMRKIKTV